MTGVPASNRTFITGISGSGKSTAAWRLWLAPHPRRLLIDNTGEWAPHANAVTYDAATTIDAIRRCARLGTWTIAAQIDTDDDLPQLVEWLIPVPRIDLSPVRVLGGMVMLLDEVDLIAPPGSWPRHVRTLYRRSRHAGLSLVSATQRPENCNKEVGSQAQQILVMALVERRSFEYIESVTNPPVDRATLRAWTARYPHGGLWNNRMTGERLGLTLAGAGGQWVAYPGDPAGAVEEEPEAQEEPPVSSEVNGEELPPDGPTDDALGDLDEEEPPVS